MENSELYQSRLKTALLSLDRIKAKLILEDLITTTAPTEVVDSIMIPVLESIGSGWEDGRVALTQVYAAGQFCEQWLDTAFEDKLFVKKESPKLAIAVLEDFHSLGKRIVYSIVKGGGYQIQDFGAGISVDKLANKVIEEDIDILLVSALMLPSVLRINNLRQALEQSGKKIKIIAGGAPFRFDAILKEEIMADAVANNASEVIGIIEHLSGS
ncbi:MAG: cobalamin-dependent protein [gamma proteobacterium symbiont of Taylorina sp.]|nr:cobalamin-dependent protein [gamma proteobacterium symbiont of Taylorina sp.]